MRGINGVDCIDGRLEAASGVSRKQFGVNRIFSRDNLVSLITITSCF
jgi:hypothetical protein